MTDNTNEMLDFVFGKQLPKEVELTFKISMDNMKMLFDGNDVMVEINERKFLIRKLNGVGTPTHGQVVADIPGKTYSNLHNHKFEMYTGDKCTCITCGLELSEYNAYPLRYMKCGTATKRKYTKHSTSPYGLIDKVRELTAGYLKLNNELYYGNLVSLMEQRILEIKEKKSRKNLADRIFREYQDAKYAGFTVEGGRGDRRIVNNVKSLNELRSSGNIVVKAEKKG